MHQARDVIMVKDEVTVKISGSTGLSKERRESGSEEFV
jgi:hypothetical protein